MPEATFHVRVLRPIPCELPWQDFVVPPGIYPATANQHGAVSIIRPDGTKFGVKPGEFERIEEARDA